MPSCCYEEGAARGSLQKAIKREAKQAVMATITVAAATAAVAAVAFTQVVKGKTAPLTME